MVLHVQQPRRQPGSAALRPASASASSELRSGFSATIGEFKHLVGRPQDVGKKADTTSQARSTVQLADLSSLWSLWSLSSRPSCHSLSRTHTNIISTVLSLPSSIYPPLSRRLSNLHLLLIEKHASTQSPAHIAGASGSQRGEGEEAGPHRVRMCHLLML